MSCQALNKGDQWNSQVDAACADFEAKILTIREKTTEWDRKRGIITSPERLINFKRETLEELGENLKRECEAYQSFRDAEQDIASLLGKIDKDIAQCAPNAGLVEEDTKRRTFFLQREKVQQIFNEFTRLIPPAALALDAFISASGQTDKGWLAYFRQKVWIYWSGDSTPHLTEVLHRFDAAKVRLFPAGSFEVVEK